VPDKIERAAHAAAVVAALFDLDARDAEVVAWSNNTIVLLPYARAVAKVGTSDLRGPATHALARELAVARHLSERDAAIVPPLVGELAGPHEQDGFLLTLWSLCPTIAEPENGGALASAQTLARVHKALADYPGELPDLGDHLARAAALVTDHTATPRLANDDRRVLLAAYEAWSPLLAAETTSAQPVHGEPHSRNFLWTVDGPRLIDFEATCRGPVEWDVAYQPLEARSVFPGARPELVEQCQLLVSFTVAAWCWAKPDRSPTITEAALTHLERVRNYQRG
jgi:hypothetical protein